MVSGQRSTRSLTLTLSLASVFIAASASGRTPDVLSPQEAQKAHGSSISQEHAEEAEEMRRRAALCQPCCRLRRKLARRPWARRRLGPRRIQNPLAARARGRRQLRPYQKIHSPPDHPRVTKRAPIRRIQPAARFAARPSDRPIPARALAYQSAPFGKPTLLVGLDSVRLMKPYLPIAIVAALIGCASPQSAPRNGETAKGPDRSFVSRLVESRFGEGTVGYALTEGILRYRADHGRWPISVEELRAEFRRLSGDDSSLRRVSSLRAEVGNESAIYHIGLVDGGDIEIPCRINPSPPDRSPEPTAGGVTPAAHAPGAPPPAAAQL